MRIAQRKTRIKLLHVVDGSDSDTAFADLAKDPLRIAVESVQGGAVERCAQADILLVLGQRMEPFIGIFGQIQPGKEPGRFFPPLCLSLAKVELRRGSRYISG